MSSSSLVAATKPPVERVVMLSKLEETLLIEGQPFELSANRYPGVVHPQGFGISSSSASIRFPIFTYEIESKKCKSICLHRMVFAVWRPQVREVT
jgi:glycogen debranching enzyme